MGVGGRGRASQLKLFTFTPYLEDKRVHGVVSNTTNFILGIGTLREREEDGGRMEGGWRGERGGGGREIQCMAGIATMGFLPNTCTKRLSRVIPHANGHEGLVTWAGKKKDIISSDPTDRLFACVQYWNRHGQTSLTGSS